MVVVGSSPETEAVAAGLGLAHTSSAGATPAVVVAATRADVAAVQEMVSTSPGAIFAVVALRLAESDVLALYDLGLPVAFGFCTPAELESAIARGPDASDRALACALATLEVPR